MGRYGHVQIGRKLKGGKWNYSCEISFKVSKINNYLIEYVPKNKFESRSKGEIKHIDPVVNSINSYPLSEKKSLSNSHNNTRSLVDCF